MGGWVVVVQVKYGVYHYWIEKIQDGIFWNWKKFWNFETISENFWIQNFGDFFENNPDQKGTKVHVKLVLITHNPPYQYTIHPAHERDHYYYCNIVLRNFSFVERIYMNIFPHIF